MSSNDNRGKGTGGGSFATRFAKLVGEFGSRYRLARISGVSESTLQLYGRQEVPPRADILFKLARAAHVSAEWLATGMGEMRPAGLQRRWIPEDLVMIELSAVNASLGTHQVRPLLPFDNLWLKETLGISYDPRRLMLLEANRDLRPEIKEKDLLLVDRSAEKKPPSEDGIFVFSVPTGLALRRVQVGVLRGFVVSGSEMSETLEPTEIERSLVGKVIWRGGKI